MRRPQRRKYHYFYITTCTITGKYYYGIHSTDDLNDGYLGSGKRLWYSINKYGKENHVSEKLEFFDTREDLVKKEIEFVSEDCINDPMCMNIHLGGEGGLSGKDHAKKFHAAGGRKVLQMLSQKHIDKLKNDKEYHIKFCSKIKETHVGFSGKFHTEESKQKMKNTFKKINHQRGENNSQYGKCWITNGIKNKKIAKSNSIPAGWKLGRKIL